MSYSVITLFYSFLSAGHVESCKNCEKSHSMGFWLWFKLRQILPNVFCFVMWLSLSATADLKLSLNMYTFVKMVKKLSEIVSHSNFNRVQKPGPRPRALAFPDPRPGQKPSQAKGQAWLGPAFCAWLGLASGFRPKPAHHYIFQKSR